MTSHIYLYTLTHIPSYSHTYQYTIILSHIHHHTLTHTPSYSHTYTIILSHIHHHTFTQTLVYSHANTIILSHTHTFTAPSAGVSVSYLLHVVLQRPCHSVAGRCLLLDLFPWIPQTPRMDNTRIIREPGVQGFPQHFAVKAVA